MEKTRAKVDELYFNDVSFSYEYQMLAEENSRGGKLIYIQKPYLGAKDTPEGRVSLAQVVSELATQEEFASPFLLVADACACLEENHPCYKDWTKLFQLEGLVYSQESCTSEEVKELCKDVKLVNEAQIAELLLHHEVLTLA